MKAKMPDVYVSRKFPRTVCVSIGEFPCNRRCRVCPQSLPCRLYSKKQFMGVQTFRGLVDQLPNIKNLALDITAYGEPLMCENAIEFVAYARRKKPNVQVHLATNGSVMSPDIAAKLLATGLRHVYFGLAAPTGSTYKWLTGSSEYENVVKNIKEFVKIKNALGAWQTDVYVHVLGIKEFESCFGHFMEKWKGIVDYAIIHPYSNWGGLVDGNGCTPLRGPEKGCPCAWLWHSVVVLSNGDVHTCYTSPYGTGLSLGNILETPLRDIWLGKRLNEIRKMHLESRFCDFGLCEKCLTRDLFSNVWKEGIEHER